VKPFPTKFLLVEIFFGGRFSSKSTKCHAENPPFWVFKNKIKILSTDNLLCRKIATFRPAPNFF